MIQDLRYGLRMLLRRPGFSGLVVLTLALGIGVSMAIFAVVNSILLRPLPYREAHRLVKVFETPPDKRTSRYPVSLGDFNEWRDQAQSFEELAAVTPIERRMTGVGEPEQIFANQVTVNLFEMLGVRAGLGRTFLSEDETTNSTPVAVLSHNYWVSRFGADPEVIDRTLNLNDRTYTIVGVLPPDFRETFESIPGRARVWVPVVWDEQSLTRHGLAGNSIVLGRLRNGATLTEARNEMAVVAESLAQTHPKSNSGIGAAVYGLHEEVTGSSRETLLIFLAAAFFVLLIACANVAGLMLARNIEREREIAIRTALGAARWRVFRQLLAENLLLSLGGGVLAIPLANGLINFIIPRIPDNLPRADQITIDTRTLLLTLLTSVCSAVLIGVTPALQAAKVKLTKALQDSGHSASESRRSRYLRNVFVVWQIALTLVLLIGAGLLLHSLVRLYKVDPGFNTDNLLTMSVSLPRAKDEIPQRWSIFWDSVLERTRAMSGVKQAAAVIPLPLSDSMYGTHVRLMSGANARPDEDLLVGYCIISEDYFETMGIRLLDGRYLSGADRAETSPVIAVNETFALTFFPNQSALGREVIVDSKQKAPKSAIIVGVVSDTRIKLNERLRPQIYESLRQFPAASLYVVARTNGAPQPLAGALRGLVFTLDKNQPVGAVRTMDEILVGYGLAPRFYLTLLGGFAVLALLLAVTGIYGVLTYTISQRTREIGIRLALGAQQSDVVWLVVGQGARLILCGTAIGLLAAFALTRLMQNLLFGVSATDPLTFIAIGLLLNLVALLACWIPARRATKLDPLVALRHE